MFTRVSGKEKGKGNALIRKSDRIYIDYITLDIFLNKVKIRLEVEAHSAQYINDNYLCPNGVFVYRNTI